MEVKIINYLQDNKGYGITISEIGGTEKVLANMSYNQDTDENWIEIKGYNEFQEMDKYIFYLNDIIYIDEDVTNMTVFSKENKIIIENWE
ncbi:hypothetical protein QB607_003160 [Clostridium botulinum]|nr:hypothetical protein [Clostridium botulinum]EKS4395833.1 hypothetical protein [Clostridium botulinum]